MLFRVVIQYVPGQDTAQHFPYLLIAYSGQTGKALVPSHHRSLEKLLDTLHAVGVTLRAQDLEIKDTQEPYILFAGELELTAGQLSGLGFKLGA